MKYVIYCAHTERGYMINMTHNPKVDFTYLKENWGLTSLELWTPPVNAAYGAYILSSMNRDMGPFRRIMFPRRKNSDIRYMLISRAMDELGVRPLKRKKHVYEGMELPGPELVEDVLNLLRGRIIGVSEGQDMLKSRAIEKEGFLDIVQYLYLSGKAYIYPSLSVVLPGKVLKCEKCGTYIRWKDPIEELKCSGCGNSEDLHEPLIACPDNTQMNRRHIKFKEHRGFTLYQDRAATELSSILDDKRHKCLLWTVPGSEDMNIVSRVIRKIMARGGRAAVALGEPHMCQSYFNTAKKTFPSVRCMLRDGQDKLDKADLVVCSFEHIGSYYRCFDLIVLMEFGGWEKHNLNVLNYELKKALKEEGKSIHATSAPDMAAYRAAVKGDIKLVTVPLKSHGKPSPEPRIMTYRGLSYENAFIPGEILEFVLWASSRKERTIIIVPIKELKGPLEDELSAFGPEIRELMEGENPLITINAYGEKYNLTGENVIVFFSDHKEVFDERALLHAAGISGRNRAKGEVIFAGSKESEEMDNARTMLRFLNKTAWEKGYLS